ncbi:MAG: hypothetical protein Q9202_006637 [Teloschistes flavicans]
MLSKDSSKDGILEKAAANVVPVDDPHEKRQAQDQMKFMNRIPKAALASILSSWLYFGYSFKCLLDAQAGGLSGTPLKVAWLAYAMQLGHAIPPGTPHLLALSAMGKAKRQPALRLTGDQCPSVDVFITYCGEEVDVLLDTVRAAAVSDYPKNRFRVIVLDDSVSAGVKADIEKLGSQLDNVFYSTRGSRPKTHTKAGNINHGLKYVTTLLGGASDYAAVFDVDMIPSPHWLRALVPHLLLDPNVALAQAPQRHYNLPDHDPLGQSMHILFDVMEPSKNATNSAWCCGSGFVVRRDALDGIGGVPEESINEDILTSFYLTAAGWRIVYVPEDLQWGMVPQSIRRHLKLQTRMCAGIISTAAGAWSPKARMMTTEEKYGALFPALAFSIAIIINMVCFIALPWLLLTGAPLVAYSTEAQLRNLLVLFLLKFGALFSYDFLSTKATNYQMSLVGITNSWPIPFQFWTLVRFALSIITGGGVPSFTPSGLTDIHAAKSLAGRIRVALWDDGFVVHVAIVVSLLAGVITSMFAAASTATVWQALFLRAFWPPVFLIWSTYLVDCSVPLSYALHPPDTLDRSSLLDRDPKTQVAYPNRHAKDPVRIRYPQAIPVAKIFYCIFACVAALFSAQ